MRKLLLIGLVVGAVLGSLACEYIKPDYQVLKGKCFTGSLESGGRDIEGGHYSDVQIILGQYFEGGIQELHDNYCFSGDITVNGKNYRIISTKEISNG